MEIGISTDQMIDVGLNLAGFLAAGLILMLVRSLFSRKKDKVPEIEKPRPVNVYSENEISSERFEKEPDPQIEYVNLGGVDWRPRNYSRRYIGIADKESRKRQNVIRLAREMMAEKRTDEKAPAKLSHADGEQSMSERKLMTQAAGRN